MLTHAHIKKGRLIVRVIQFQRISVLSRSLCECVCVCNQKKLMIILKYSCIMFITAFTIFAHQFLIFHSLICKDFVSENFSINYTSLENTFYALFFIVIFFIINNHNIWLLTRITWSDTRSHIVKSCLVIYKSNV